MNTFEIKFKFMILKLINLIIFIVFDKLAT